MQLEAKKKNYSEISTVFQTRKDLISERFASKIEVFQDSIEVAFYLYDNLQSKFNERYENTGKKVTGPKSLIPFLFVRNIHYLIAANELVLLGLINPSNLNLRAVFENITMMYLLNLTTEEAELYYKKEMKTLTKYDERDLNGKYRWFSQSKVGDILYTKEKKAQIQKYYSVASYPAHPTIKGTILDIETNYDAIIDTLNVSLAFSAANLIAFHESYFEIFEKKEIDEIENSLDKISKELDNQIPDIIPNNPNVVDKLKINLQHMLIKD